MKKLILVLSISLIMIVLVYAEDTSPDRAIGLQLSIAIIGGLSIITSSVITVWLTWYLKQREFHRIKPKRQKALCGKWIGTTVQIGNEDNQQKNLDFELRIRKHGKMLKGIMTVRDDTYEVEHNISGGFINDNYIKFDYKDSQPDVIRFGVFLAKVSADPRVMEGRFLGYSADWDGIAHGYGIANKIS